MVRVVQVVQLGLQVVQPEDLLARGRRERTAGGFGAQSRAVGN